MKPQNTFLQTTTSHKLLGIKWQTNSLYQVSMLCQALGGRCQFVLKLIGGGSKTEKKKSLVCSALFGG
jgi:hypothetical protein